MAAVVEIQEIERFGEVQDIEEPRVHRLGEHAANNEESQFPVSRF